MYEEYARYCEESGKVRVNQRDFPRSLIEHGYTKREVKTGNVWIGVRVGGASSGDPTEGDDYFTDEELAAAA